MLALKRILHPTDFSKYSAAAARYACALAAQFGAELHLLHVLELHVSPTPTLGAGLALCKFAKESQTAAEQALAAALDPQWEHVDSIVRVAREGAPFVEICRYAKAEDIDLIVMGTHGRSALPHLLIGSVAERVVRKAPCPVLTVRAEGHQFVMPAPPG